MMSDTQGPDDTDPNAPPYGEVADPYEFPVPFAEFVAHIKGTPDEVYTVLLRRMYGDRPRLPSEWRALLDGCRAMPAR